MKTRIQLATPLLTLSLTIATGACVQTAGKRPDASVRTVVQVSYYAQPGRESEVLENRMNASAVLAANGVTRGRVMSRINSSRAPRKADDPDVVWEGEFPDSAALQRYEQVATEHPDFRAARTRMNTLTRKPADLRYFEVH